MSTLTGTRPSSLMSRYSTEGIERESGFVDSVFHHQSSSIIIIFVVVIIAKNNTADEMSNLIADVPQTDVICSVHILTSLKGRQCRQ